MYGKPHPELVASGQANSPSTLVDLLCLQAKEHPNRTAFKFLLDGETEGSEVTYKQLDLKAKAIGAWLQSEGADGARVLLPMPIGLDYIAALFGCFYAGAIAVPTYPPRANRTLQRFQSILEDSQAGFALAPSSVLSRANHQPAEIAAPDGLRWLSIDDVRLDLAEQWQRPPVGPEHTAFLQYTSGSTATPKGIIVTHLNLLHNERLIQEAFRQTDQDIIVSWLPLYHDMGLIGNVIQPIYLGASCILMSPMSFLQRPYRWLRAISDYRATTSGGPNFAYDLSVSKITPEQKATLDLSSWAVAFNGSEPVRAETMQRFYGAFKDCGFRQESFHPCYGLAEATLLVAGNSDLVAPITKNLDANALEINRVVEATSGQGATRSLVGCGGTSSDQKVRIVNPETRLECSAGQVGEVWVSGPSVAQGYWNRPAETKETFHAYLADTGEGAFLRTGDMGFLLDDQLFVTGRLKDLIIIRGLNFYPQDIEMTVEECHPALKRGFGVAFSVEADNQERLVIVQAVESRVKKVDQIISTIRHAVALNHGLEAHSVVLTKATSIPKTTSGKIRRQACKAAFLEGRLDEIKRSVVEEESSQTSEYIFAREALFVEDTADRIWLVESYLRDLLGRVLKRPVTDLSGAQQLTATGLDSLKAVEFKNLIEDGLGVDLPVVRLLDHSNLNDLARDIVERMGLASAAPGSDVKPAKPTPDYPLSYIQQSLWFIQGLNPDSAAYNISIAARLNPWVNLTALEMAFRQVRKRHPLLRTVFSLLHGQMVQRPASASELYLDEIDASDLSAEEVMRRITREANLPFDLSRDEPLRAKLFKLSSTERILLLSVHHIAIDGWSFWLMLDELGQFYTARMGGSPAQLAPIANDYEDYVRWQADLLAGPEGERLLEYWQGQLAGEIPVLNLPVRRTASAIECGSSYAFKVDEHLTARLRQLAARENVTLYTLLLAAFQVLLYRYSQQREIIVGTPMHGRSRASFAGTIGCFFNPMPLVAEFSAHLPFNALLAQVREKVYGALAHQDYPSHLLAQRFQSGRGSYSSGLYRVMFILQQPNRLREGSLLVEESGVRLDLGELKLDLIPIERQFARADLELEMIEAERSIVAWFHYSLNLFGADQVAGMASHFQTLLGSIVDHPDAPVSVLQMLPRDEADELLNRWSRTGQDYSRNMHVHDLFDAHVKLSPDKVAAVFEERCVTFEELDRKAVKLANLIRKLTT